MTFERVRMQLLRVPNRFFGIRDLAYFKAGIRDLFNEILMRFNVQIVYGLKTFYSICADRTDQQSVVPLDSGKT